MPNPLDHGCGVLNSTGPLSGPLGSTNSSSEVDVEEGCVRAHDSLVAASHGRLPRRRYGHLRDLPNRLPILASRFQIILAVGQSLGPRLVVSVWDDRCNFVGDVGAIVTEAETAGNESAANPRRGDGGKVELEQRLVA